MPAEDPDPIQEVLRRDAARIAEPPFDPALHHAAMRRIRALADTPAASRRPWLWPAFGTVAAALSVALIVVLRPSPSVPNPAPRATVLAAPPASLVAYQLAAARGDDALFSLLDHDAQSLLPPSAPIFNTSLR